MEWQLRRPVKTEQRPTLLVEPGAPTLLSGNLRVSNFDLWGYDPHPPIKAKLAV